MSKYVVIIESLIFVLLIAVYFFIATRKPTKLTKSIESITLIGAGFLFAFSKTISNLLVIIAGVAIIFFNSKRVKNERRNKGYNH